MKIIVRRTSRSPFPQYEPDIWRAELVWYKPADTLTDADGQPIVGIGTNPDEAVGQLIRRHPDLLRYPFEEIG